METFKKILKVLSGLMSIAFLTVIFLTYKINSELADLNSRVVKDIIVAEEVREPAQPIGVLLLGVDSREGNFNQDATSQNDSRSDAILLATLNPQTKQTVIASIPRDTLVPMKNREQSLDKVNHSYMFGGVDLTLETVSDYFDVPIHYVVEINMQGLEDLVDAFGGVTITPTISFVDNGFEYIEGQEEVMSGDKALWYTRMRKKDPKGDIGRGQRQQEVIEALAKEVTGMDIVKNYMSVLEVVKDTMRTNAIISTGLMTDYLPALTNINNISVERHQDYKINGVFYLGLMEEERVRVSNQLRHNINLTSTDTDKGYIIDNANRGDLRDIDGSNIHIEDETFDLSGEN